MDYRGNHLTGPSQMLSTIKQTQNAAIEKGVNIENIDCRTVQNNNVYCTDKSHQDKKKWNRVEKSHREKAESYCHLEKYQHVCRVTESCPEEFKTCVRHQFVCYCSNMY